ESLSKFTIISTQLLLSKFVLSLNSRTVAGSTWMYAESKRLDISFVGLYVLLGVLVSFSCAFPLFLFVRESKLEKLSEVSS
ncbi:DUF2834 domain-containing protein, partial [Microcoleus sp. S28C3]|uniref:DUF2834 domain-containing protein n=1 Tax=Microcoleus sp. S28C3 TaxID=3055414 RepID=UPI002FD5C1DD